MFLLKFLLMLAAVCPLVIFSQTQLVNTHISVKINQSKTDTTNNFPKKENIKAVANFDAQSLFTGIGAYYCTQTSFLFQQYLKNKLINDKSNNELKNLK